MGGISRGNVLASVDIAVSLFENGERSEAVPCYGSLDVSAKVIQLIQGYTDIVNRNAWRKAQWTGRLPLILYGAGSRSALHLDACK